MSEALVTPLVSCVVGVRDGAERLTAAVESLLSQQGPSLEVVVVDDGSRDDTPEHLARLAVADARVRVLRQERLGLTAALRRGCAAARGTYIARQDADEVSAPGRLARQVDALASLRGLALASCWTAHVTPEGEALRIERGTAPADVATPVFAGDEASLRVVAVPTQHGSTMFPRALYERVGGYRAEFLLAQDWDLWLRLGEHGQLLVVGEVLLTTVQHPRSLSFAVRDVQLEIGRLAVAALRCRLAGESEVAVLARVRALAAALPATRGSRAAEALGYYHLGDLLRRRGSRSARRYLLAALRRNPLLLRAWVRLAQTARAGRAAAAGEDRG